MKTYEHEGKRNLGEIDEYSKESVAKAIESLESLIETLSQTAISVRSQSKEGQSAAEELQIIIESAKGRLAQLKSVVDLKQELKLPYQDLDSLELGEHLLIQLLIREYGHIYESQIAAYIQAAPAQRHTILVEMLGLSGTYSLNKILEKKTQEQERQEMLNQRHKWANPF